MSVIDEVLLSHEKKHVSLTTFIKEFIIYFTEYINISSLHIDYM